jgi:hypothetical protein
MLAPLAPDLADWCGNSHRSSGCRDSCQTIAKLNIQLIPHNARARRSRRYERVWRPPRKLPRQAFHRRRCASAMRARPAAVFGPVDSPPWKRHLRLPGSTLTAHGLPCRLRAPHVGRSFRGRGSPSPVRPIARCSRQATPSPQACRVQVRSNFEAGQATKPCRCQLRQAATGILLPEGGPCAIRRSILSCSVLFARSCSARRFRSSARIPIICYPSSKTP